MATQQRTPINATDDSPSTSPDTQTIFIVQASSRDFSSPMRSSTAKPGRHGHPCSRDQDDDAEFVERFND